MKDSHTEICLLPLRTARACRGSPAQVWVLARGSARATSISLPPTKGTARIGRRSAASRATRTMETVPRQASAAFSPGGVKFVDVDASDLLNICWKFLGYRFMGKQTGVMWGERGRNHQCKEMNLGISKAKQQEASDRSSVTHDCAQTSLLFRRSHEKDLQLDSRAWPCLCRTINSSLEPWMLSGWI